jgi:hypothetical protein
MDKHKYSFYGDSEYPPVSQEFMGTNLPEDINNDAEIVGFMKGIENESGGKAFNAMMVQFRKNKWWGFVMYSLNGREIAKFNFMAGVVVRKELRMWADGWSFQDLKNTLLKLQGVLIGIPEAMRSSQNDMVSMKRRNNKYEEA